ncbi:MAG TPA: tetratricopeptide repeat protein [Caulobacteraceae bacterium]
MPRSSAKSSASAAALGFAPPPEPPPSDGDGASPAALAKLEGAISELKALAVAPMLRRAIAALREEDPKAGSEWALKALNQDPESGMAWYVLAVAREKAGDFTSSIKAYQSALALLPEETEVANDLGRLAFRMGMKDLAEQLFRRYLATHPTAWGTMSSLATTVKDQGRFAEAIDILRTAVKGNPTDPQLWNALGTVVSEQADFKTAIIFYDEALRLDPEFAYARYNRGNARLESGDTEGALEDCEAAVAAAKAEDDRAMMQLARSTIKIGLGRIGEGWDDYEARLNPLFANATAFLVERPLWTPEAPLAGKHLLVMGEQGLGDEVLFGNLLPEVLEALGPDGKLTLALEPRLVPLFQRSFPTADVVPHVTYRQHGRNYRLAPELGDLSRFDLWVPMASLLRRFRRRLEDFPARAGFLAADPASVAHWREALAAAPAGRKVGILWKSMKVEAARARYYSPFQLWTPVLRTPGVTFVNVQYGDCSAEIEWARRELGVDIWTPPGIDLKQDLDDIAALTSALDLTMGFANATSNIAAACGAPTWIISVPGAWTRLGTDHMPWYPTARIFNPPGLDRWEETMAGVAEALAAD